MTVHFFKDAKLRQITTAQIAAYQNARTDAGRAPKTINGEVSVLRQVLKRAKLWYRFADEYTALRNRKPPVGRALTAEEQQQLFAVAQTKPAWLYAYVASTLAFYCGLRACEIEALHWQDVDWSGSLLHVRRSKTPAGWRSPMERDPERNGVLETCEELGIGFVPWGPVGMGYLPGRMDAHTRFDPKTDLRSGFDRFSPDNLAANRPVVDALKRFAEKKNATPAQTALAWLLAQKPWIVPIPGTRNTDHLNENVGDQCSADTCGSSRDRKRPSLESLCTVAE